MKATKTYAELFIEYAINAPKGVELRACEINEAISAVLGHKPTMCPSDFAKPETDSERSNNNPELFIRVKKPNGTNKRGYYIINPDLENIVKDYCDKAKEKLAPNEQ